MKFSKNLIKGEFNECLDKRISKKKSEEFFGKHISELLILF